MGKVKITESMMNLLNKKTGVDIAKNPVDTHLPNAKEVHEFAHKLVAEYVVTTANNSIIFENLDILKDGGIYDIIIDGESTREANNIYMRINDIATAGGYIYQFVDLESGSAPSVSEQHSESSGLVGFIAKSSFVGTTRITLSLLIPGRAPVWSSNYTSYYNGIGRTEVDGYTNSADNVTKIQFMSSVNFAVGTTFKIYRRGL